MTGLLSKEYIGTEMMKSNKLHECKKHHYLEDHFHGFRSHMSCRLLLNVATVNVLVRNVLEAVSNGIVQYVFIFHIYIYIYLYICIYIYIHIHIMHVCKKCPTAGFPFFVKNSMAKGLFLQSCFGQAAKDALAIGQHLDEKLLMAYSHLALAHLQALPWGMLEG